MVKCVVIGCKNYSTRKNKCLPVRYFSFPCEKELIKQWINVCQLDPKYDVNNSNSRVCSDHFVNEDYSLKDQLLNNPLHKRKLKKNAVPSVNIPAPMIVTNRLKRFEKRSVKKLVEEIISTSENFRNKTDCDVEMIETFQDNELQAPEYVETVTENLEEELNCCTISDDNTPKLLEGVITDFKKKNYIENQPENVCTRDVGIQTMVDLDNALQLWVLELEREVQSLKAKLKASEKEKIISRNLKKFFTEGQVKKLSRDNKRIVWQAKDISSFILGRADSNLQVSLSSNTLIENDNLVDVPENNDEILSSTIFSSICNTEGDCSENLEESLPLSLDAYEELPFNNDEFQNDSLQYVAGYIAKKLKLKDGYIYEGGMSSRSLYTWLDELSQGGLKKPTEEFLAKITNLNNIFNIINGDNILIKEGYLKHHLNLSSNVSLREDIKMLFFKTRMYFRIRALNRKLSTESHTKKNKKTFT